MDICKYLNIIPKFSISTGIENFKNLIFNNKLFFVNHTQISIIWKQSDGTNEIIKINSKDLTFIGILTEILKFNDKNNVVKDLKNKQIEDIDYFISNGNRIREITEINSPLVIEKIVLKTNS